MSSRTTFSTHKKHGPMIINCGEYSSCGELGLLAKGLKNGNNDAINDAARLLSSKLEKDCIIVPMPSHYGDATYMKEVADRMRLMGFEAADCLRSNEHLSSYIAKKRHQSSTIEMDYKYKPSSSGKLFVIDNVLSSGKTMDAARAVGLENFAFISNV